MKDRCQHRHREHGRRHNARLQVRLFAWSGVMILVTGLVVALTGWALSTGPTTWQRTLQGATAIASRRFADVWEDAAARSALASEIAAELTVGVVTLDERGAPLDRVGAVEGSPFLSFVIERRGTPLGRVQIFTKSAKGPRHVILPLFFALLVLWGLSGLLARRLARPLAELAATADAIGRGELERRTRVARHAPAEVVRVAEAIDDMAQRIQRQMADSRELLAAVSHEVRSPLARIRLLVELARPPAADASGPPQAPPPETGDEEERAVAPADPLTAIEREVEEIDALVGSLLASSRLDFGTLDVRDVDPLALARDALLRAGLPARLLDVKGDLHTLRADPTLLARALANLLDNARIHGGGASSLRVAVDDGQGETRFEVDDDGPGLGEDVEHLFQAFHRRPGTQGALGLGLAIVARIAEAHGGRAFAEDRPSGGARIGFTFAMADAADEKRSPGVVSG